MTYWIQNADISTAVTDEVVQSADQVLAAFDDFDWKAQLDLMNRLVNAGEENCPPGIGVVRESGVILHLCPQPDDTVSGFWHTRTKIKVLGIFNSARSNITSVQKMSLNLARESIVKFIKGDDDWLLRNFKDS